MICEQKKSIGIQLKDLSKLGYRDNVAYSLIVDIIDRYCRYDTREQTAVTLGNILGHPESYKDSEIWSKLAERLSPTILAKEFLAYDLREKPLMYKTYGGKFVETLTKQQMNLVVRLPITIGGALMPDAHADYGLPTGGVLATDNAVIPYAAGVDIGCRMSLIVFDAKANFLKRYSYQIREVLKDFTHFRMDGGLGSEQEHEVLDREEFQLTLLLKDLQGKAVWQLGGFGDGNRFVKFGEIALQTNNVPNLSEGSYTALLLHSGSCNLGAAITKHCSLLAHEVCKLPQEAQHFTWLSLNSKERREYWMSMNLAGDYTRACHERIHLNLSKALGLKPVANVNNHHNFVRKEETTPGRMVVVRRKGATPAQEGQASLIPGGMATAGYLVCGKGVEESLYSASHGAGRVMSRQKTKESFTQSVLKEILSQADVTSIGGSVEEVPLAYKDIDRVMCTQGALVEVQSKFMPRIVRMDKE